MTLTAAKYEGLLRFDPAGAGGLLEAVNPALGPVLGLVVNLNDTRSSVTIARAENLTDLVFFRKRYVMASGGYTFQPTTRGQAGGGAYFPPMSVWIPAGGKGLTREGALQAALGEYFERFQGAFEFLVPDQEAAFATTAELATSGRRILGPDQVTFFHDRQFAAGFPYAPFSNERRLAWTAFRDVHDGGEVLVPAQLAYLTRIRKHGEELVTYSSTGGLAFGRDFADAFEHGLLEYIERDAVNLAWISGIPARRIELDTADLANTVTRLAGSLAQNLVFIDFATDLPGVFVVGAYGHYRGLFLGGAGADFTFDGALFKAAGEIMQCYDSLRDTLNLPAGLAQRKLVKEDLFEFSLILQYYSQPDKRPVVETWAQSLEATHASKLRARPAGQDLAGLLQHLKASGLPVLFKEFRVKRVLPTLSGALVRVLPPFLIPAHIPNTPFLGNPRYLNAPVAFGLRAEPLQYDDLNLAEPVPMP
ncbi:MAG TPA: YcaO-like family protein [Streptosporangiaceae bacterium]|nr:YcaO-like family protein [Streptosporangiaceae bacterium]